MYTQIYLDYNATTPCDTAVVNTMLPYFNEDFGNPSSSHHPYGWLAKNAVEEATEAIAIIFGVPVSTLTYTSGATESINMVLKGLCRQLKNKGNHIITTKAEHKAVLDTCAYLESEGFAVTYLDVEKDGTITSAAFEAAITPQTIIASILYANNETGIIQPLAALSAIAKENDIVLFSDTTQALGKVPLQAIFDQVDFCCFSAHKLYGPKGIGLVYSKKPESKNSLPSFIQGGGQQHGLRGGTLNTPAIVGFAKAVQLASDMFKTESIRLENLRNRLEMALLAIPYAFSNSTAPERLPNTTNISFGYIDGESLLRSLSKELAVSNGSACNSASVLPSHVLTAMGIEKNIAYASLRLSLGRYTTEEDINQAISIITKQLAEQREQNILWERRS